MKDFLGRTIEIGQYVATFKPKYREMMMGRVKKLTPKQVVVKYGNTWNYSPDRVMWLEHRYWPTELIVLTDEYAMVKILDNPIDLS